MGNRGRPYHARHHDLARRDFGVAVSFHSLHLWNLPSGDRHSNAFWKGRRTRFREEPSDAFLQELDSITPEFSGEDFRARVNNRWMLTPLGVALIVIDVMDLVFAVDSIPAVFAITQDPFIVYTSNKIGRA